jgi:hypothetical protein
VTSLPVTLIPKPYNCLYSLRQSRRLSGRVILVAMREEILHEIRRLAKTNGGHASPYASLQLSRLRLQELNEGFQGRVRDVVLHPLGIGFGSFGGDAQRKEDIHNQPVTCSYAFGERASRFRQKHAAIGARRCNSAALKPRDGFDGGDMRDTQAACDIGRTGLACRGQQVRNKLDIVLKHG